MLDGKSHRFYYFPWLIGCLVVCLLASGIAVYSAPDDFAQQALTAVPVDGNESVVDSDESAVETSHRFATTIRKPAGPPTIELSQSDPQGRTGNVACSTCHSVREPDFTIRRPQDLSQFHQKMPMAHGSLTCYSCHNPTDADTLRLADTTTVEYSDVMTLCAQCHGSQARDYKHGAHGGMTGYWDLSRGPRTRNSCIDCHDPHVPKFTRMLPTFKPQDRFLSPPDEASHE